MSSSSCDVSNDINERARAEFLAMPGLRLTCEQRQRLWGLDAHTCRRHRQVLVDAGFLATISQGLYARRTDGRRSCQRRVG